MGAVSGVGEIDTEWCSDEILQGTTRELGIDGQFTAD
jgi:hypothetical protein